MVKQKKYNRTNNDLQNIHIKLKIPLKIGVNLGTLEW